MENGPPLFDIEKGQILAFDESNLSHREIARRVNRSAKVMNNFLRDSAAYGTNYKPGRERALGEARKTGSSARELQATLQLSGSVRTIQRELQRNDLFDRHSGSGSVMVWGCFSSRGLGDLAFISGRQNSEKYCNTLGDYLLPFAHQYHAENILFQQDGASCHRAQGTVAFLREHGVAVVGHLVLSPDLNSIENLWGLLARAVYRDGCQFMSENDLKSVILSEWGKIELAYLSKLVASMPERCFQVIERKGAKTTY